MYVLQVQLGVYYILVIPRRRVRAWQHTDVISEEAKPKHTSPTLHLIIRNLELIKSPG